MNHIARLTQERDELAALVREIRSDLTELARYYQGDKFAWPDRDFAHVRTDVLPRITAIQFKTCGV